MRYRKPLKHKALAFKKAIIWGSNSAHSYTDT